MDFSGLRKQPAWQRVLYRLWYARLHNEKHRGLPPGWLPIYEFQKVGGSSGDRRFREIRDEKLVPTDYDKFEIGEETIHAYRLDCDPYEIDWQEIFDQGPKWRFRRKIEEVQLDLI